MVKGGWGEQSMFYSSKIGEVLIYTQHHPAQIWYWERVYGPNAQTTGSTCIKQIQTAEDLTKLRNMCPIKVIWCWMCLDSFLHFLHFLRRTAQTTVHIDNPTGQEVVRSSVLAAECAVPTVHGMAWHGGAGGAGAARSRRGLEVSVYQQDQLQGAQGQTKAAILGSKVWLLDESGKLGNARFQNVASFFIPDV